MIKLSVNTISLTTGGIMYALPRMHRIVTGFGYVITRRKADNTRYETSFFLMDKYEKIMSHTCSVFHDSHVCSYSGAESVSKKAPEGLLIFHVMIIFIRFL